MAHTRRDILLSCLRDLKSLLRAKPLGIDDTSEVVAEIMQEIKEIERELEETREVQ